MSNFPSPIPPDRSPAPKQKNRKALWILLAVAVVALLLLFLIPELFVLITMLGIILAVIGLVKGKIPWLPIHGRKNSGLFAGAMVVLMFISGAIMGPSETTPPPAAQPTNAPLVTSTESPTPTPSPTAIADFVGQECKDDELVMEQGAEKLYCDENTSGALAWATQADHDKAVLAAKKAAEEKAVKEKAAAEKKEAEAKAIAEKKAAEKKAADKKAAEAKAEREAEQAAAAEAERRAAKKAEQEEAARLAEIEEEQQSYVSYANCTEARAAGAAPISRGEPGYASHLDRDGDGIGCDS